MDRVCEILQKIGQENGVSDLTDTDLKYLISANSGHGATCNGFTWKADIVNQKADTAKIELMLRSNKKQYMVAYCVVITNVILAIATGATLAH